MDVKNVVERVLGRNITPERLGRICRKSSWKKNFFSSPCGHMGIHAQHYDALFQVEGDEERPVFLIKAIGYQTYDGARIAKLRRIIEYRHQEHWWPKCYPVIREDQRIDICAEHAVAWEQGATDADLEQQIECAMGAFDEFYSELVHVFAVEM